MSDLVRGISETVRVGSLALQVTKWSDHTTDFKLFNEKADYFQPLVTFKLDPDATDAVVDLLDRSKQP